MGGAIRKKEKESKSNNENRLENRALAPTTSYAVPGNNSLTDGRDWKRPRLVRRTGCALPENHR